jgi:cytochrome c oxidase subunit 1
MTRLPLTIWALLSAIIGVVSFPVLLSAALLLIFDRSFERRSSSYLISISPGSFTLAGSPVLLNILFWFLGHPEVFILFYYLL